MSALGKPLSLTADVFVMDGPLAVDYKTVEVLLSVQIRAECRQPVISPPLDPLASGGWGFAPRPPFRLND